MKTFLLELTILLNLKFLQAWLLGVDYKKRNVWWNYSAYNDGVWPEIFTSSGEYIPCKIGTEVKLDVIDGGVSVFYVVTKVWSQFGSDWLSPSDAYHCDLTFNRTQKPNKK